MVFGLFLFSDAFLGFGFGPRGSGRLSLRRLSSPHNANRFLQDRPAGRLLRRLQQFASGRAFGGFPRSRLRWLACFEFERRWWGRSGWSLFFPPAVRITHRDHGAQDVVPRFRLHHHLVWEHATIPANVPESFGKPPVFAME